MELAKILVVDDDDLLLVSTRHTLEAAGYQTVGAMTGEEGLRQAYLVRPQLMLLDVNLPDMNGLDVCRQIKSDPTLAGTYVAMFSGMRTDVDSRVAGLEQGADDYLVRPLSNRELIARVHALLRIQAADGALRRALAEWQTTFNAVSEGVVLTDPDLSVVRCNRAALAMLGVSQDDVRGLDGRQLVYGTAGRAADLDWQQLPDHRRFVYEYAGRWLRASVSPVWEEAGQLTGIVHVLTDITAERRAEQAAQQHVVELQRWNALMLDREDRILQLKHEVNLLQRELGRADKYPSATNLDQASSDDLA